MKPLVILSGLTLMGIQFLGMLNAEEPLLIRVTGQALVVNGVGTLSPGLFGVHHCEIPQERWAEIGISGLREIVNGMPKEVARPGPTAPGAVDHVVTCFFDRYRPAHVLSEPKTWQKTLHDLGRDYGRRIADLGPQAHVEFWNEPYLNWATKPAVNLDPRYYETAGIQAGDRAVIRGLTEPTEFLVWRPGKYWVPADPTTTALHETYVAVGNCFYRMKDLPPGETWEYRGKTHRVIETLVPYDTSLAARPASQRWYSGRQFGIWYEAMLRAFGSGLRETAPQAQLIAGWGFHLHQGDGQRSWIPWESLFKPLIDSSIDLIDGIHEHHYGGDTRVVGGAYETVNAYSTVVHGKALACYNTEAGANFDPQRPDAQRNGTERWFARFGSPQRQQAMMAYHYLVRDIIFMAALLPDKARSRAAHASHDTSGGDELGFRQLRQLRGLLLVCEGADADLWAVATRPQAEGMTVVMWNDRSEPRSVRLDATAPADTTIVGGVLTHLIIADATAPTLIEEDLSVGPQIFTIPPRQAVAIHYRLLPRVRPSPIIQVLRQQVHADRILVEVTAQTSESMRVRVPASLLATATRAWVQVVANSNQDGEVGLHIDGQLVTLPPGQWIIRQEIPTALLAEQMTWQFSARRRGFSVWSASILVDTELAVP